MSEWSALQNLNQERTNQNTLITSRLPCHVIIEDITRWQEDMNFTFKWQELYLTSEYTMRKKIHIFELTCNVLFII